VTGEALKALDLDHRYSLYSILADYFDEKIDIEEFHWGNLRPLQKKVISPLQTTGKGFISLKLRQNSSV